jgi:uncharacterized ferritin-like protein (DUF455 family)
MEIREFAERILFGDRWQDKLIELDRYEDAAPGAGQNTPDAPGRPQGLRLDEWHGREKMRFRDVGKLHSEKERGLVLHFFANHELLALELMALALLKFPQAPEKFRRGLVQTLKDEQEHVRLYKQRMAEIGVEFGQIPVSDYFWKAIAPMETPRDFVTGLSLTLEQANLDYAVHYAQVYQRLDDGDTAAILQRVYKDEIGHVKHGLTWFERWRDEGLSQWQAYEQALRPPLSPARAKGLGFNREGRLKAGLQSAFIDELEIFSRSRGRCPDIYWFNANCEAQVVAGRAGDRPPKLAQQLEEDLRALPMLYCAQDDVVLVQERPSVPFLRRLRALGFGVPEFVEYGSGGSGKTPLAKRKIHGLRPWGWSPESAAFLRPLAEDLALGEDLRWAPPWAVLYSKAWSATQLGEFLELQGADWLCGCEILGRGCRTVEGVIDALAEYAGRGHGELVIKAAVASSGRGQIHPRDGVLREGQRGWLENMLKEQGEVVVEPWLDKVMDLSLHFDVGAQGEVRVAGWTRFFTDARGQYRGSFIGQMVAGLDAEVKKFLYVGGQDPKLLHRLGEELATFLGRALSEAGYVGPVGVDALVYRDGDILRFKPVVELNPRQTMGRVALALKQRVNAARTALWLVVSRREAEAAGCTDLTAWAERIEKGWPAQLASDGEQLSAGAIFTTDPAQVREFAMLLLVAETLDECRQRGQELGLDLGL